MNIEKSEEKPFEGRPQKKEPLSEGLTHYKEEGQRMIDGYRSFFATFARDVSLSFQMSDGFYIDLEKGVIHLDTKWFADKDFTNTQIVWANLHELSHFLDLAEDPEKMMESFESMRRRAQKTGAFMMKKWEDKYGATDPEFIESLKKQKPTSKKDPSITMNAVEQGAYQFYHLFYNIFDDIYVNQLVARKASHFEEGTSGGEEVEKLYREKLFAKTDHSELPRHLQLLYSLLREEMVSDESCIVGDEVREILKKKIVFMGHEYTLKEIIDQFIKPKGRRDTKAGKRYFVLQKTIEPVFEQLLMKDLKEWDPQKPEKQETGESESQKGEGNPFDQEYKKYKTNNPDQINDQDMQEWMDKRSEDKKQEEEKKKKEKAEDAKSAYQKDQEAKEKMDREKMNELDIPWETYQKYKQIEAEVKPYIDELLQQVWQKIIYGSTRNIEREMEGHFPEGTEPDIGKIIEEWAHIEKGSIKDVAVMREIRQKETLIRKPELIRVRLVGDMSESMNEEKKHVLQQCFVLLLSSLSDFDTQLRFNRSQTKSKLKTDTEAWIFGDEPQRVKHFLGESGVDRETEETIRIFEKLQKTIGSTYDNKVIESIVGSLTTEDIEKIKKEKIMDLVCEITDGGSSDKEASKKAVDALEEAKIIGGAFQIGTVTDEEKDIFNYVWNEGRKEPRGFYVGPELKNLLPALVEWLKKYLGGVRL